MFLQKMNYWKKLMFDAASCNVLCITCKEVSFGSFKVIQNLTLSPKAAKTVLRIKMKMFIKLYIYIYIYIILLDV